MTNSRRLTLTEDLTIYHALEQKNTLLDALAASDELELDLLPVSEMDTAGLQLLMLLKREVLQQDKRLTISGHSPAVQHVLDFCNLVGVFGDPLVISANA